MKFIFKEQDYQIQAVKAVTDVLRGQPYRKLSSYTRDEGKLIKPKQMQLFDINTPLEYNDYSLGFANSPIEIDDKEVLANIQDIQTRENINFDKSLVKILSPLDIDVEMETGTGKTYVYIRTIFELNKLYGFSKFIVVVPSIAIREGVKKSFEMTQDHFMSIYQKKARFFIYNSANLAEIDTFAKSNSIQVMIINIQAFNTRGKDSRKIFEELDSFQSRKPIDVIKKTNPILILDEPQKMGGSATKKSIGEFNPLFTLNYSATHKEHHNLVYVLDAVDAFNKKLVKKIEVKAIEVKNIKGTSPFLYLSGIELMPAGKDPKARITFYQKNKDGSIKERNQLLEKGDNIYELSNGLQVYKNNYIVSEIDYLNNQVKLLNGTLLKSGEIQGDVSEDNIRRVQIRETIISHIEKEEENFHKGIKTLSLFFVDEVIKYRDYSKPDEKGEYARIFEEEYADVVNTMVLNNLINMDEEYKAYLRRFTPDQVHKGYFSVDKKGHAIDSKADRQTGLSDDISAYDLILKNKERLLSFDEPTRFIFSHSALREGWDNPNVFQICTLRHTQSGIQKRQEVGRGLRIAVDKNGNRQDSSVLTDFFGVNKLTVIANEYYDEFVKSLQTEIASNTYQRPMEANSDYFAGKTVININTGEQVKLTQPLARKAYFWLAQNEYIDENNHVTDKFRDDKENGTIKPLPDDLKPFAPSIIDLISNVGTTNSISIENGLAPKVIENKLNANFNKKEFQELWNSINHKYSYRVAFDSDQLIKNCIEIIKKDLKVSKLSYTLTTGQQKDEMSKEVLEKGKGFEVQTNGSGTKVLKVPNITSAKYDLVYEICKRTSLIRKTVAKILIGTKEKLQLFRDNPEEYISNISELINAQKASVIVSHISYEPIGDKFDSDIFNEKHVDFDQNKCLPSTKAIQDYVFVDGNAKNGDSIEMKFAKNLEAQQDIKVYAKMPKGFYIPTPMGKYSPDWAIVCEEEGKRNIYFIAETKGSLDSLLLRKVEDSKITCAKKLYNRKDSKVNYDKVTNWNDFFNDVQKLLENSNEEGAKNDR